MKFVYNAVDLSSNRLVICCSLIVMIEVHDCTGEVLNIVNIIIIIIIISRIVC